MALKPVLLLLLWVLFADGAVASLCNITCSTDYVKTLNCSCSGVAPSLPVRMNVSCRDDEDEIDVTDNCTIQPSRSWCTIVRDDLAEVASVGTKCTMTAHALDGQGSAHAAESVTSELCDMVKPQPPHDVKVASGSDCFNITWLGSKDHCLTYRVRIRTSKDSMKEPDHVLQVEEERVQIHLKNLQLSVNYTVDVQAKLCPGSFLQGPWSEWSPSAEFLTEASRGDEGMNVLWLYISGPIVLVLAVLLLGYLHKPCWTKKLKMITYIPSPSEFFRPLDERYGGNFKDWVKPVFDECDYVRMNSSAQMMSKKKYDILRWSNENETHDAKREMKEGGQFLSRLQAPGAMLLDPREAGGSEGAAHSTGHISIHTVTIYGESFGEGDTSQSSLQSYRDGESFGSFEDANRDQVSYDLQEPEESRMDEQSRMLPQRENQIADDLLLEENLNFEPEAQFLEAERVSLDSFASNEHSEDGYPHVDLDTVDSGFGECGSPGVSDSNRAELIDSFLENKNTNSNYVKQWMICGTIHEDSVKDEPEDAQKL